MKTALAALVLVTAQGATAPPTHPPQEARPAPWRMALELPVGDLPFGLELGSEGRAWLVNGPERIPVGPLVVEGEAFVLPLPPYRSRLIGTLGADGAPARGEWQRDKGAGWVQEMTLRALGREALPPDRAATVEPARFTGRWSVAFSRSDERAVGVFDVAPDGAATGTFLTTLGDYRYLAGRAEGRRLTLACFDGAHAFLFEARALDDGTLRGDFWSRTAWHENWSATRDADAALPDGFGLTRWTGAVPLGELAYPDLDLKPRKLDDPAFAGRARLLVVFGSWCPNCNDLTDLLARLHAQYGAAGLAILGLAFEVADDPRQRADTVRAYMSHHGATWPVLLAGPADKDAASAAFPLLDRVRAYPTTVFMDASGAVKAVYTGFSGPATGAAHAELVHRFEAWIEALLHDAPK